MARQEQDREDLLREATALVERIELAIAGESDSVVAGFRRDGCGSVYFGGDAAFHFNTQHQLRRAFEGGLLYKADRGRIVQLRRQRTDREVQLLRRELSPEETARFLDTMNARLKQLRQAAAGGEYEVLGQVPPDAAILPRLAEWLAQVLTASAIAKTSHAR